MKPAFSFRRLVAEALGTALLVATVVGSGIMAETLTRTWRSHCSATRCATGAILVVLITIFGPISGAHFDPGCLVGLCAQTRTRRRDTAFYVVAQIAGGIAGTMVAH